MITDLDQTVSAVAAYAGNYRSAGFGGQRCAVEAVFLKAWIADGRCIGRDRQGHTREEHE